MKINRKKAVAVAVAAVMSCGLFAGCDLVTRNEAKNLQQTVATVDITKTDNFKAEFGLDENLVAKVIMPASISKMDMIAAFVGAGYSNYMNYYGWSYKEVFDLISKSLAQNQISIQYAKAYFLKNGWTDKDDTKENPAGKEYTYNDLEKFNAAVKDEDGKELTGVEYEIAVLKYFLTEKEIDKASYTTRVMLNNSIDSTEKNRFLDEKEDDKEYDSDVRTTPTGLNTSNSDYYDPDYLVYTGTGIQNAVRGSYEPQEGSTTTTRLRAYNYFITGLESNGLVKKGEDTSDIESLEYFKLEYKSDLENALVQKLTNVFAEQAEETLTATYVQEKFDAELQNQSDLYRKSSSTLESAMGSVSDTNFVLTATGNLDEESAFGFVINILLPFSAAQSDELNSVTQDFGDTKGNKFVTRAQLLSKIKATDQRGSWFRGETDYSFKVTAADKAYTGADSTKKREWLFFEDNLKESDDKNIYKYERLKNYYGQYTYNGTWNDDDKVRKYKPNSIDIDDFIMEMEGYLKYAFEREEINAVASGTKATNYYASNKSYYYTEEKDGHKVGDVNYEQFVYYQGKVNFDGDFNANQIFKTGSQENVAMSVINELSFAYNTDTGGLNSYLGYAVTANKTNFVSEFEYAAQKVVLAGAGNYIVVPSDYGWHIIYCTFSFVDSDEVDEGIRTPFKFNYNEIKEEGTFSNLFYEDLKADTDSKDSTNRHSMMISTYYKESCTIYEKRYSDLSNIGNN
ncbi:MAG: hypothetical protein HDP28_01880 [Clostridia bacterium]|nr:hypothetical protein [Clostridia bacterium]